MEFLHSEKLISGKKGASTQKYVDVEEIKDDVIVLKNGSLRAILLVSSINFDLKSSEEQDAIIGQYQNFLNSLDFPIQIVISSRKFNIKPYLDILEKKEIQQENELLKFQISEYKNFVENLIKVSNIVSKFFYIVIPFYPVESREQGLLDKIMAIFNPRQITAEKKVLFETYKNQLWQRADHISAGLSGIGVRVTLLKTEEIIELLYNSYNPSVLTNTIIRNRLDEIDFEKR